jgi:hypothetical protein
VLNFEVTLEEANVILAGLGELPSKMSHALINKLQTQAAPQIEKQRAEQEEQNG